jgi:succinate dehydrogenase / fumarate reductase, cytochrome b subunit
MGQIRADAQGPEAQARAGARGSDARPLSPHLQVWRWHITMAASILTRATGMALFGGAFILAGWAVCLAMGPECYAVCMRILGSIPGKIVLFGLTFSLFYHLAAGLRHIGWDLGYAMTPKTSDMTAAAAISFGVFAAVAVFVLAYLAGAL